MTTTPEQLRAALDSEIVKLLPEGASADAYRLLKPTEYMLAEQAFKWGCSFARKQALEEAITICNSVCSPYSTDAGDGYNEGVLDCGKKLRELLK